MQTGTKRQKEQARLEHRRQKEAKREERKRMKAERPPWKEGDPDPSIEYPVPEAPGEGAPQAAAAEGAAPSQP
jgi:hypothetical protein